MLIKRNRFVPEQDHHEFIYKEGKKIPKPADNKVYIYLDKYGIMQYSKWEDTASKYGNGKYLVTDEEKYIITENVDVRGVFHDKGGSGILIGKEKVKHYCIDGEKTITKYPGKDAEMFKSAMELYSLLLTD